MPPIVGRTRYKMADLPCKRTFHLVLTQLHSRIDFSISASLQVGISDTQYLSPMEYWYCLIR